MPAAPQEILLTTIMAHLYARCVQVVAEAGVADHLEDAPKQAAELATATGVDADALHRILRSLVSWGIFEASPDGYSHNDASRLLRSDHPASLRAYARMMGSDWQWRSIGALGHALKTGETGMRHIFGEESFDYLSRHPAQSAIFNEAMTSRASIDLPAILEAYDFSRFPVIADIGGGQGKLLLAILDRCPQSSGVLFDLPHVLDAAAPPPSDRLKLAPGDFFRDPLPTADAYLLRRVIHDWRDEPSIAILAALRGAAKPGAHVFLLETPLPEGPERNPVKGLDIVMLAVVSGRERTIAQYQALMESAGLRYLATTPTRSGMALIEGVAD